MGIAWTESTLYLNGTGGHKRQHDAVAEYHHCGMLVSTQDSRLGKVTTGKSIHGK